jgi:hypothetical protein
MPTSLDFMERLEFRLRYSRDLPSSLCRATPKILRSATRAWKAKESGPFSVRLLNGWQSPDFNY